MGRNGANRAGNSCKGEGWRVMLTKLRAWEKTQEQRTTAEPAAQVRNMPDYFHNCIFFYPAFKYHLSFPSRGAALVWEMHLGSQACCIGKLQRVL